MGLSWVHLGHGDALPGGDVLDSLLSVGDDADGASDGLGSDGMVASDHDDLDTGRPALDNGVRDGGPWGIDHGHEADKTEAFEGEVFLVRIEGVASWVLVLGQHEVAETKDTFSKTSELHVSALKGILPVLSHRPLLAVDDDGGAPLQDPLWGALHHQQVPRVRLVLLLVDRDLELVGRVERDLADFLVPRPVVHHVALAQLGALEDGGLGGISVHLPLQDRDLVLASLELGPVAQAGNALQRLPSWGVLVEGRSGLVLRGVRLNDLVVEPHVRDGHPVLGEGASLVRADARGGAEGLDSLQVLHQAVLGGHPLGSEGETHSDSGKETLGDVGHDDTDQEDDSIKPVVAEDEGNDEEGDSKEDSDTSDDVDKMGNFLGNGSLIRSQTRGKTSNSSHDSVVSNVDDNTDGSSFHRIGGEESKILGLQWILVGEFGASGLWL